MSVGSTPASGANFAKRNIALQTAESIASELMRQINIATAPKAMSREMALNVLQELYEQVEGQIEALIDAGATGYE